MGILSLVLLFLPYALPSSGFPCSALPGYFNCTSPACRPSTPNLYHLAFNGTPGFAVATSLLGGGWGTALLTFSFDNSTVVAAFDNHHVGKGAVGANCGTFTWNDNSVWTPSSAPSSSKISVHISPHSHDDVGWDCSYMGYFNGCFPPYVRYANVSQELTNVVLGLLEDPRRRFSEVEQAYFQIWYEKQAPAMQAQVQTLVAEKRLVFLNGAFSMHDEANPTYVDMLDNTALGHRYIVQNFGVAALPKMTWQIDPFGHSAFQGVLSSSLGGFRGLMWGREDAAFKAHTAAFKGLERVWLPSPSLGPAAAAWQGIFWDAGYSTPGQVARCDTEASPTPQSCNYAHGVPDAAAFAPNLLQRLSTIRGSDLLVMMGTDFCWPQALLYFNYTDGLIDALNAHPSGLFNASYSTPERYMMAKLATVPAFPAPPTGDFFPYADDPQGHNLWAGYFTSRPAFKGYVRESSAVLQAARQLQVLAGGGNTPPHPRTATVTAAGAASAAADPLTPLERGLGVAQHHDAISGTAKAATDADYTLILHSARGSAFAGINASLGSATGWYGGGGSGGSSGGGWAVCALANVSHCPALERGQATLVAVHNALGQAASGSGVRLSVGLPPGVASYAVADHTGAPLAAQLVPLSPRDEALRALYNSSAFEPSAPGVGAAWLCFLADLPAAGFSVFFLTPTPTHAAAPLTALSTVTRVQAPMRRRSEGAHKDQQLLHQQQQHQHQQQPPSITNGRLTLTLDATTSLPTSLSDVATGLSLPFSMHWAAYTSANTTRVNGSGQPSGAYIFRPFPWAPTLLPSSSGGGGGGGGGGSLVLVTGPIVNEAQAEFEYVSHTLRLWGGAGAAAASAAGEVEVEYTVGPVNVSAGQGQEVIVRYGFGVPLPPPLPLQHQQQQQQHVGE